MWNRNVRLKVSLSRISQKRVPKHAVKNNKNLFWYELFQNTSCTLRNKNKVIILNVHFGLLMVFLFYHGNPSKKAKLFVHEGVSKEEKLLAIIIARMII